MKDLNDPSNRDTIPAMLTEGEFVMNKESTAMFGPQIEAMNNAGLAQRQAENEVFGGHNMGGVIQTNQYNTGGLVTFLKDKEGWKDTAYQDDAGVWTIGYGRTGNVKKGDTTTKAIEDPWLDTRAAEELAAVKAFGKKHGYEWSDGQMNALASFRYNGGQGMIDQLTAEGTRNNDTIQKKFGLYNKITNPDTGKKEFLQGLQNRRDFELELWNGTTPTETVQAVVPGQDLPVPEVTAEVGGFPGGDDIVSAGVDQAVGQIFQPPQMMAPPQMPQNVAAPEFIPSVTQNNLPTSVPQMPTEESNPMNNNSLWNSGGPVYLNRGGVGKKKVWDSATQKYIFVDPSDIRVEQEKALAASAPVRNNQVKPMAFAQAAQPNVTHMGPRQYRAPHQSPFVSPDNSLMQFDRSPDDIGDEIQRGWNKEDFDMGAQSQPGVLPQMGSAPQVRPQLPQVPGNMAPPPPVQQDLPPVPMSDEALLQGGSQQVEMAEQQQSVPQIDQAPPMNFPNNMQPGAQNLRHGAQWDTPQAQPMTVPNQAPAGGAVDQSGTDAGLPAAPRPTWTSPRGELYNVDADGNLVGPNGEAAHMWDQNLFSQAKGAQDAAVETETLKEEAQATIDAGGQVDPAILRRIRDADAEATAQATNLGTQQEGLTQLSGEAKANTLDAYNEYADSLTNAGLTPNSQEDWEASFPAGELPGGDTALNEEIIDDPLLSYSMSGPATRGGREQPKPPADTTPEEKDTKNIVDNINADSSNEPPMGETNPKKIEAAGMSAMTDPSMADSATSAVKEAFGSLFDKQELVRAAIMFAGALATGASPGRALAFAGQNYLSRIDNKASMHAKQVHEFAKGGKFSPSSVAAKYSKSKDLRDLRPLTGGGNATGTYETFHSPHGSVKAREV